MWLVLIKYVYGITIIRKEEFVGGVKHDAHVTFN